MILAWTMLRTIHSVDDIRNSLQRVLVRSTHIICGSTFIHVVMMVNMVIITHHITLLDMLTYTTLIHLKRRLAES